jgi:YVTN family beta-propeller protein
MQIPPDRDSAQCHLEILMDSEHTPFDAHIKNNSLALSPNEKIAAVSYSDTPEVIVYDLTARTPPRVLWNFITPRNIVFASDGRHFYVSDSSLGEVVEIDANTLGTTRRFAVGAGAFGTAITHDGRTLFVNNQAASTLTIVDIPSGRSDAVLTGFAQPRQGIKISSDGKTVLVANFGNDQVAVVDAVARKIFSRIGGFNQIRAISLTRESDVLYAANSGSNSITEVNVATGRIVRTIPVGRDPYGATLSADQKKLLTSSKQDGTLDIVDLRSGLIAGSIGGFLEPRQALVYSRDGKSVYVLNKDLSIGVVDLSTASVSRTLHFKKLEMPQPRTPNATSNARQRETIGR